ncbi:MAG: hypothetical protein UX68_C0023G0018 [Parcubacteria group bacterium GW2011_GWA2_46_9]|nr:MAG: hypothetical protein UX68_C0023G0018 [Parcubacteria group bacterium GW2011_GWA2_46_9]
MAQTLYLWDLANTLFPERWDSERSGVPSYDAYVEALGYDLETITPHDYEWAYERPYKDGLFVLSIADGFREVLTWTKNNAVFTTGNREQVDWRAEQLHKKYDFDIRDYIKEICSTFDFGNTNRKTKDMLENILDKKYREGFRVAVYTDDNLGNCEFFIAAATTLYDLQKNEQKILN